MNAGRAMARACVPPRRFCGVWQPRRQPPWFSSSSASFRRLADIHQDRIVHSGPLATPCRTLGRSYNPAYVFGFPKRIDRMTAPIAIIMGSQSDWDTMRHAAETLAALGVACEKHIVSAHRTPDRLFAFAKGARGGGFKIIIAGGGGAG